MLSEPNRVSSLLLKSFPQGYCLSLFSSHKKKFRHLHPNLHFSHQYANLLVENSLRFARIINGFLIFMFFFVFQEILNGIVEKGPMYSHEEYATVLRLLCRSDPTPSNDKLAAQLAKLADIMKKVGVPV